MSTACGLSKNLLGNFLQHLTGLTAFDRIKTFFSYLKEQKTLLKQKLQQQSLNELSSRYF